MKKGDILLGIILFVIGFILTVKGGNMFVDSAAEIAEKMGIPKFIVGATVVSLATTCPELSVSVLAVLHGSKDMGIGNAIGSVSCNIGIGMAVGMLFSSIHINMKDFFAKGMIMIAAAVMIIIFSADLVVTNKEAVFLMAVVVIFFYVNIDSAKNGRKTVFGKSEKISRGNILYFVAGAVGIIIGARFLVEGGQEIAHMLGIPEKIIGVTLIAIGTSIPEITTAIIAAAKGESGISVGNIVGANIIDMALIIPVCTFISDGGLLVEESVLKSDVPAALALCVASVIPVVLCGKFKKWQAFLVSGIYVGYIGAVLI